MRWRGVLAGKDDGWDLRLRRLKPSEVPNCLTFWTALSVGNRWSPVILAMHVHNKRGLSFKRCRFDDLQQLSGKPLLND